MCVTKAMTSIVGVVCEPPARVECLPKPSLLCGAGRQYGANDSTSTREVPRGVSSTWMPAMPSRMTADAAAHVRPAHDTEQARMYMCDAAEAAAPMSRISITAKRTKEMEERFGTPEKLDAAIDVLRRGRVAAAHAASSHKTWSQNTSIMRFWFEFCEIDGLAPTEFGVVPGDKHPKPS